MNALRISAMALGLAAASSAFASAANMPALTPLNGTVGEKLQPAMGAMGAGFTKRHSLLAGASSKKSHAKGWMAAKGPKVTNTKKS